MNTKILYLGDTAINQAASYLAGIMAYFNIEFDYVPSDKKIPDNLLDKNYRAIIISDYPSRNFTSEQFEAIRQKVISGTGLMMIGGWESFVGIDGKYNKTILADILPIKMQDSDDRINCSQPCLVEIISEHPIVAQLPFTECPPGIGGYNLLQAKSNANVILASRQFKVNVNDGKFRFMAEEQAQPLLIIGEYQNGRTLAFASDVAPHWVGGLVDWGDKRICACATKHGAEAIEVGNHYSQLFVNMIKWVAKFNV